MSFSKHRILTSETNSNHVNNKAEATVIVNYPNPTENPYTEKTPAAKAVIESKEHILELILQGYIKNPIKINDYVVLSNDLLIEIVKCLTKADDVKLEISYDLDCCGNLPDFNTVDRITIIKDGLPKDFKIGFNEQYNYLRSYNISLKFTHD